MKKVILTAFVAAAMLTSCGGASEKGNWSDADKEKANAAMEEIDDQLSAFGDKKQDFIDCYLGKVEENYASFAEADKDLDGCSKIAEDCASDVMGM